MQNAVVLFALMLFAGCSGSGQDSAASVGAITAKLVWQETVKSQATKAAAPAGVATVRIIVSGDDMSAVQQDFAAAAGSGTVGGIPTGTNRTVTFQGLNAGGGITHQAVTSGVTVSSGPATDLGTVTMLVSVAPAAPANLAATVHSSSRIDLAWSDSDQLETGFVIERKTGSSGTYSVIATTAANVTGYSDTGLAASTTYYYRICAINSTGSSAYTDQLSSSTLTPIFDTWLQKADFFGTSMREPLNFSIGDKGYVGITGSSQNEFWEYTPNSNSWSRKADLPDGFSFQAPSFVIASKAYIVIGVSVWQYDPNTNVWSQKNDIPGVDKRNAFGFSIGDKGYIGGGFYNQNHLYEYDPGTDNWTEKNVIPKFSPHYNDPNVYALENVTFSIGTKAYVTGTNMSLFEYDPSTDSWTKKIDYPDATYAVAFSINQKGYIVNTKGEMKEYDPATNLLTLVSTFSGTKVCYPAGFSINGTAYIGLGGVFSNNTCTLSTSNDFWGYSFSQ